MAGGIPQNLLASMSVRLGMDTKAFDLGTRQAKGNLKGFQSNLSGIKLAFGAVFGSAAIRQLFSFANAAKDAYKIQAAAETKLETVMTQRFGATKQMIEGIKELASEQQKLGVVGEEVILSGGQQLATFLKQEHSLRTLIPAMNNLIAQQKGYNATAEDAVNVANMMGKVLDGQVGALRRVGITFTETQERLLKTGDEMQRAATLAQVITDNVGNMNQALAGTELGKLTNLENKISDINELIGKKTIPLFILWKNIQLKVLGLTYGEDEKIVSEIDKFRESLGGLNKEQLNTLKALKEAELQSTVGEYGIASQSITKTGLSGRTKEELAEEIVRIKEQIELINQYYNNLTTGENELKPLLEAKKAEIEEANELWKSSVTEKELLQRKQRLEQLEKELKLLEELGTEKYFLDQQKKKDIEGLSPLKAISATGVTGKTTEEPGLKPTINTEFIDQYALSAEQLLAINEEIQNSFADLTSSMVEAFAQMAASGEGFQPGLLLLPIANVAENLGKLAISTGIATMGIKKALESLQGPVAIAAGIALVALAAAVKAKMSSMASGASVSTSLPSSYSGSTSGGDFNINRNYGERSQVIRLELDHKIEGDAIRLIGKRAELTHSMQS